MHTNGHHPAPTTGAAHTLERLAALRADRDALRPLIDRRTLWTWSALVPSTAGRVVDVAPFTSLTEARDTVTALYRERDERSALRWECRRDGEGHVLEARAAADTAWIDTGHRIVPSVRSLHGTHTTAGEETAPPTPWFVLNPEEQGMVAHALRAELAAWRRWYDEYGHEADTICTSGCFGGRVDPACKDCIDVAGAVDRNLGHADPDPTRDAR